MHKIVLTVTATIIVATNTHAGRWLSRDPIQEGAGFVQRDPMPQLDFSLIQRGANLYYFVANDPVNIVDPFGLDFIAVGDRYVQYTPGLFRHMSIEFFEERCPQTAEGTRFSAGSEPGTATRADSFELQPLQRTYRHFFYVSPKPTEPPVQSFVWDLVSEIRRRSTPRDFIVIYSDFGNLNADAAARWRVIVAAATTYPFGEQRATRGALSNWPNSKYELFGNNSNTFIREMARAIGRNADVIGGWHPGNVYAVPVPDPGYVPVYSPWGNE